LPLGVGQCVERVQEFLYGFRHRVAPPVVKLTIFILASGERLEKARPPTG
jgi:hypothetical protein